MNQTGVARCEGCALQPRARRAVAAKLLAQRELANLSGGGVGDLCKWRPGGEATEVSVSVPSSETFRGGGCTRCGRGRSQLVL